MLILVAHGTRVRAGARAIEDLTAAVSARIDCVQTAFVDVIGPSLTDVLARSVDERSAVVVPAFLATGFHVRHDVPAQITQSGHPNVRVMSPLGPDPVLADILLDRLIDAGWQRGDAVVMAAAGSTDPHARNDLRWAARLLAHRVGRVHLGYVATGTPRVADVVSRVRAEGARRVFVASYLLAPGLFHDRLSACGATAVASPLGLHPGVVDLLASRFAGAERVAHVA